MAEHAHTILYAEDDHDDLLFVKEAFELYDDHISLYHAENGFQALLQLQEMEKANTLPCLVIFDINMPGMNGKEALMRIKQTDRLKNIPAVLFTTSSSENDKKFAENWGAVFITKPLLYAELEKLAKQFLDLCTSNVSEKA
jgi:CheY-like chemotaxis protein